MSWLSLHRTHSAELLIQRHPKAFLLLSIIAMRARYLEEACPITGLSYGQAFIGDWQDCGQESYKGYRLSKNTLTELKFAAFKGTSRGTIATLLPRDEQSMIYTISNDRLGQTKGQAEGQSRGNQGANEGPLTIRKEGKKEKRTSKGELSPECYRFADWFESLLEDDKKPDGNWRESFAKTYDELTRLDNLTKDEIKAVCEFGTEDHFWKNNFTIPSYLRKKSKTTGLKHFVQIRNAMNATPKTFTKPPVDLKTSKL